MAARVLRDLLKFKTYDEGVGTSSQAVGNADPEPRLCSSPLQVLMLITVTFAIDQNGLNVSLASLDVVRDGECVF